MDSSPQLKYFTSLPLQTYDLKIPSSESHIQYICDISQATTEEKEEDPSSYPLHIHFISFSKLFQLLTDFEYQDPEIFKTVLYGYFFFIDEKTLFEGLISRFRMSLPWNLSKNEAELFKKKILKTIQLKVIIFLQHWFKNQKYSLLLQDREIEALFIETLYCLFNLRQEKWLGDPMNRFFNEIEELSEYRIREARRKPKLFTTFLPIFMTKGVLLIRTRKRELAQCLSLFDQANFERISVKEIINRGKRSAVNKNYYRFIDSFNFLAKFVSFLLLNLKHTYARIEFFEDVIDLIDELKRINNFHSGYAIFLGISYPAVARLKHVLHQKLSKNYRNKLEEITELFDNPTNFRETLQKAVLPCVPSLNIFTKELSLIDENFKMRKKETKEEKMIDFLKTSKQSSVIKRLELYRTCRYCFSKKYNEDFIRDFDFLPNIEEDILYDLSKNILP